MRTVKSTLLFYLYLHHNKKASFVINKNLNIKRSTNKNYSRATQSIALSSQIKQIYVWPKQLVYEEAN